VVDHGRVHGAPLQVMRLLVGGRSVPVEHGRMHLTVARRRVSVTEW
jgi:hypothetical protein